MTPSISESRLSASVTSVLSCRRTSSIPIASISAELRHERTLVTEADKRLSEIDGVTVYGPPPSCRSGVVSFTLGDVHPHDLATILDGDGVCIRAGNHCAQPLMRRLDVSATARASFYVYNDRSDIDALIEGVLKAKEIFGHAAV